MDSPESENPEGLQEPDPANEEEDEDEDGENGEIQESEELVKAKKIAQDQRVRAEKAEKELKNLKSKPVDPDPKPGSSDLSQGEIIYIAKADVHEDDIPELLKIARTNKISVSEAHKLSWVRTWLNERNEERATAEATASTAKNKGSKSFSGADLLDKARTSGDLPDDPKAMDQLVDARFAEKKRG